MRLRGTTWHENKAVPQGRRSEYKGLTPILGAEDEATRALKMQYLALDNSGYIFGAYTPSAGVGVGNLAVCFSGREGERFLTHKDNKVVLDRRPTQIGPSNDSPTGTPSAPQWRGSATLLHCWQAR